MRFVSRLWVLFLLSCLPGLTVGETPRMAVIIDDLGDRLLLDRRAVDLPVPLSCAILPHTPHARRVASDCAENGKEVMLHLPLQAKENNQLLGPGRLELDMDEATFRETFRRSLASVPGVRGVNNHMGSLLTRHPGAMAWLMEELREAGLFFIDSRTTPHSVAYDVAREHAVPAGRRDIFLDRSRDPAEIEAALDRAIRIAHQRGEVVVIGHPYPETLEVLEARLPWLETESGVELINASALLEGGDDPVLSEGASDEQASAGATGGRL